MNPLSSVKSLFALLALCLILSLGTSCKDGAAKGEEVFPSVAGTYQGTATIKEQLFRNGVLIFDTNFTSSDQLIVTEVDVPNRQYHFELLSSFKTYYGDSPLAPTGYFLDENYSVWEGLDQYGYTYDNKKHWRFNPLQDTAYFYLAYFPYGPTVIDDPDSVGHSIEILHTWNYILRGNR